MVPFVPSTHFQAGQARLCAMALFLVSQYCRMELGGPCSCLEGPAVPTLLPDSDMKSEGARVDTAGTSDLSVLWSFRVMHS